jgi:hypothetical protein
MTKVMAKERRHTVVPCSSTFAKVLGVKRVGIKIPVTR